VYAHTIHLALSRVYYRNSAAPREQKLQCAAIGAIKFNKTIFNSLEANNFQLQVPPQYATLSLVGVINCSKIKLHLYLAARSEEGREKQVFLLCPLPGFSLAEFEPKMRFSAEVNKITNYKQTLFIKVRGSPK
jgi:hypothetical protein